MHCDNYMLCDDYTEHRAHVRKDILYGPGVLLGPRSASKPLYRCAHNLTQLTIR
jgi:hypothetical protein